MARDGASRLVCETVREVSRRIHLGVFPMGIDAAAFTRLAEAAEIIAEAEAIKKATGNRKLLVGVDRLDHTKGLVRRMLGLERLLLDGLMRKELMRKTCGGMRDDGS